ncbi:MAG TPA: PRC-barrel domain-containing protein [Candidatus Acidoferrum sp.]|nr:PRC-barrel domain-containing protein [Candidatus Acidoferrum sp.]
MSGNFVRMMLKRMKELEGARLEALDGEIGRLRDFCFDDRTWAVRYVVVEVGLWPKERLIVISPAQGVKLTMSGRVQVALTKRQIRVSPSIDADKPVSLQFQAEYYEHSNWPAYRDRPCLWGPVPRRGPSGYRLSERSIASPHLEAGDPHLRSANEVSRYSIQALDHKIGHLEDFILDPEGWVVRYLVADIRSWFPGKRVLLPSLWISWISWPESKVYADLDRESIKHAPEYKPSARITREYETDLFGHYGREPYWAHDSNTPA